MISVIPTSPSAPAGRARRGMAVVFSAVAVCTLAAAFIGQDTEGPSARGSHTSRSQEPPPAGQESTGDPVALDQKQPPVDGVLTHVSMPIGEDVLAAVRKMNSHPLPDGKFEAGHVSSRRPEGVKPTRTATGFTIRLPSGTPVPTPTVYRGRLYSGGGFSSREFYCFDATSGRCLWAVDLSDDGPSWPVASEGTILFNTESCTIFALDAETGKQHWSWYLADPLLSSPTVAQGRVFTVYPAAELQGAVPLLGKDQNAGERNEPESARPATHVLVCFDLKSGRTLWRRWIDSDCISAPVATDDELFIASFSGTVYRFRINDGAVLAAVAMNATSAPVVAGGRLYVTTRSEGGTLKEVLAAADRSLDSPTAYGLARSAPYLDRRVQEQSRAAKAAAGFEASNGILGGFGGGFSGGMPSLADPPDEAASDSD
ncbi:MAG: PQQ-like beta-propeller repeat protein, partial [Planctomycetes bacterium]|nr:PQQ-like beta-propeller repeat protein [Planctomycetota bacterium]